MKLYELTEELKQLEEMDLPEEARADTLESLAGEFKDKGVSIGMVVKNIEADIEALANHKKDIEARMKTKKGQIEWLKNYLRENMDKAGIKKIEHPLFNVTCRVGSQMVEITNPELLPDHLVDVEVVSKPKKKEILELLKAGEDVQGAVLVRAKSAIGIK